MRRWVTLTAWLALAGLGASFALRFPWTGTARALRDASPVLVAAAVAVNLVALFAKGLAWHLILRPHAPHRLRSAQAATLVGAAVNCLSVSVGGEAARVHALARLDQVGYGAVARSVLASRVVEGLALALFLAAATAALPWDHWFDAIRLAAWSGLGLGLLVWRTRGLARAVAALPRTLRERLEPLLPALAGVPLALPLALGVVNWVAEWGTYHLAIESVGARVPAAGSLAALVVSNLGAIPRLTPANVGVLQTSLIVTLAPFSVSAGRALAAGLILQAVQTAPILLLGTLFGAGLLRETSDLRLRAYSTASCRTPPPAPATSPPRPPPRTRGGSSPG